MEFSKPIAINGYKKFILQNTSVIKEINLIIDRVLPKDVLSISTNEFRSLILKIQNSINEKKYHHVIVNQNKNFFDCLFPNKLYHITSVAHVRGVRPSSKEPLEFLGLHRENFYADGDYINHQINIQIPIRNYNLKTSMYYIPRSHLIPDKNIKIKKMDSKFSNVERFSDGHKIGLSYNPKLIQFGFEKSQIKRVNIKMNQGFAFSSRLIHGGGINLTNDLRFSLDFGILPENKIQNTKIIHFASYADNSTPYQKISVSTQ